MRDEYDFSNAEQGRFFVPLDEIQIPIYLDRDILRYFRENSGDHAENIQSLVNDLLRKDIEIANRCAQTAKV